ncbi:hypothetical protein NM208_g2679 [Fusarium decemcellulare]|uniref:Uncharacterized protein n=1 Tax=Fusarium decemcellulare TaxID=57161 RepID=A0ACC1SS50_9HYPO|nr:hypothetical protein NM208_g2679 [Fusarium decemcellulare]
MNLHFIWIYSLCIIQDSPQDLKREALAIEQVYENSLLNLCAATGSNSSHRSFVAREPYLFKPLEVTSSWDNQDPRGLVLSFSGMFAEDVVQSPLRTRAWVYQEFFLSGRSLILARGQMWWHCRNEVACEGHPSGYSPAGGTGGGWVTGLKSNGPKSLRRSGEVFQRFSVYRWKCLVQDYVQMRLTKETDRVFAFSAIVRSFGKSESMEDQYLAGLWRRDLPRGLFWGVDGGSITHRADGYRAPSWSWVSLEGPFAMPATLSHEELIASLENVWPHYNDHEKDLMALSKGAGIEICGHLIGPRNVGATGKPNYLDAAIIQSFCGARPNSSEPWHEVTWDEHDAPGKPVISYADNLNLGCRGMGLVEGASRETVRLGDAQGTFFFLALHIYKWTNHRLSGIVLYQPIHQAGIIHRVGIWEAVTCPDGSSIKDIGVKYPKQTVYII